jgi:peptidoglycan/xylan/chitin deacetylase (PgdA/CDA1 family)
LLRPLAIFLAAAIGGLLAPAAPAMQTAEIRFVGKTKYLNAARAVVVHSIDDSTKLVVDTADTMDKYGVKGTFFISTEHDPPPEERFFNQLQVWLLWPRLQKAVDDGHEIGSHAVTHPCGRPPSEEFCAAAYDAKELTESRDEILQRTTQPYVWTWAYPCGHCAEFEFIQQRIAAAGYIVARSYPGESQGRHVRPDLQTWAENPYSAAYTQVVQRSGGRNPNPTATDVPVLNAKFDEVYGNGGIYHFMTHPQSIEFGAQGFYERHLAHIARRPDVWYVPMGPLYAYATIVERTDVQPSAPNGAKARFTVSNTLDRRIYHGSLTLEFRAPAPVDVLSNGTKLGERGSRDMTNRWDEEYIRRDGDRLFVTVRPDTTVEFR